MLKLRSLPTIVTATLSGLMLVSHACAAGAFAQDFSSTDAIVTPGTIMSLVSSGTNQVHAATNTGNTSSLIGVAAGQPLVELATVGQRHVRVAVSGTALAIVSDINGPIAVGDKITASPITGVGMKAITAGQIVGTAQVSLNSVATSSQSIVDRNGRKNSVKIGSIPITVDVQYYTPPFSGTLSEVVPPFLQNLANAISGKHVSPLRVIVSLLVLILGSVTVIVMLYGAIRTGIISIGRNPLAERALRKGLRDVILTALGISLISAVIVFAAITG